MGVALSKSKRVGTNDGGKELRRRGGVGGGMSFNVVMGGLEKNWIHGLQGLGHIGKSRGTPVGRST